MKKYIPAIDGLRAVAILIVLSSHILGEGIIPGGFGVTLFFFISGYLITEILIAEHDATRTIDIKAFYIRRFRRLAPALLSMVGFVTAIYALLGKPISGSEISAAVFYYLNYYAIAGGAMPLPLGPLWSLAIEEHYYLVYPLVLLIGLRDRTALLYGLLILCIAVLLWRYILVSGNAPELRTYTATDTRIDSIVFGALLALLMHKGATVSPRILALGVSLAAIMVLASLLIRGHAFRETLRYSLQGLAMLPVFYAVLFEPRASLLRIGLENPALVWIGKISYSLYLWHFPAMVLSKNFLHQIGPAALAAVTIVVSFSLATASYYWVEMPLRHKRGP
jgi:peptidoglycan/LPS O-acetylase OafA/YrhL